MESPERAFRKNSLLVARSFRALGVSELAVASGVSRKTVSAIENGAVVPSETTPALNAIAAALRFPREFFFSDVTLPALGALHFRTSKVPDRATAQARARAALLAKLVGHLAQFVRFAPPRLTSAVVTDSESIEQAAEAYRRAIGIGPNAPFVHAIRAAEAAGVFVGVFNGDDIPMDGFAHAAESGAVVMLNSSAPWSRRRFSVMHEIGHLVLHSKSAGDRNEREDQANRFAGAALCPRGPFWREFPRPNSGRFDWAALIAMKERWGVSLQALVRRALHLQLINEAQFRTACIHVSHYGWKTAEPAESIAEEPEVLRRLVLELDRRAKVGALCRLADVSPENIEETFNVTLQASEDASVIRLRPSCAHRVIGNRDTN